MQEHIKKILDAGIRAPSGDNCQPWRFAVAGNRISVYNLPKRDNSLYSWGQRASNIAHGALIENMLIAARDYGYNAAVKLFPDPADADLIAHIDLEAADVRKDPLFAAIAKRATNRKPYEETPLAEEQLSEIRKIDEAVPGARILLIQDPKLRRELGLAAAMNEQVLFENRDMHSFLFGHLNWSDEEDEKKKLGFSIKTFELPPPVRLAFNLFKNWKAVTFLNKLGLSKMIPKTNGAINAKAGAFAAVIVDDADPASYVTAGRAFERLWLTATQLGLSMQPLTGILFLMRRIAAGDAGSLSPAHVKLVENEYAKIADAFGVKRGIIAMMSRIGISKPPSAHTHRLPPQVHPSP